MDSQREPASLATAAYHIVEAMDDYPTLVRLSMTNRLFYDLITERRQLKRQLFDRLETGRDLNQQDINGQKPPQCNAIARRTVTYPQDLDMEDLMIDYNFDLISKQPPSCASCEGCWCNLFRLAYGYDMESWLRSDIVLYGGTKFNHIQEDPYEEQELVGTSKETISPG